jgi:ubiquinone/menaquinone biosynthesis C-methylase UbiE
VQRDAVGLLNVHAHLHDAAALEREAEGADTGKAAPRLADGGSDLARNLEVVREQVDVEGNERPPRGHEDTARRRVESRRAVVGSNLAGVDPPLQLRRPSTPEERRPAARTDLPVEEHRQADLVPYAPGQLERGFPRPLEILLPDGDERHDVGSPDSRVRALVAAQVDSLARAGDAGEERLHELALVSCQREDRTVVIRVRVYVQQARVPRERIADRVDRRPLPPFGEVRHRFERVAHVRSLGPVRTYYDRRAPEYDGWYRGIHYEGEELASFLDEVAVLEQAVAELPPARTLDVACGTGFLTRHLRGDIVGLDQSERMLEIAREQASHADYVRGDAFALPFPDCSFDRVFSGHFYGHLEEPDRIAFLAEARRVAPQLVVVDAARRPKRPAEEWQERVISDGSTWPVFKRFFRPAQLVRELGGGDVAFAGRWFVVVTS